MITHGLLLVVASVLSAADGEPAHVGQIFVVGNTRTRSSIVLRQVPLYCGQVLDERNLRIAEENLARLGRFQVDREKGIHPRVTVIDPGVKSDYRDILVQVEERPRSSLSNALWEHGRPYLRQVPWWLQLHWKFRLLEFVLEELP